jgi:REP element-mobilizing transposase RayT
MSWWWNHREEFIENKYYHIYNRWFNKQFIFHDDSDYNQFYKYIIKQLQKFDKIKIVSFSFLPNHFHFVLHNLETGLLISNFMRLIQWSYSMYYKNKYKMKETGLSIRWPFFEWRFKSKSIDTKNHLEKCLAYVNFNPLRHNIVDNMDNYKWTSYHQLDISKIDKYKGLMLDELEY